MVAVAYGARRLIASAPGYFGAGLVRNSEQARRNFGVSLGG